MADKYAMGFYDPLSYASIPASFTETGVRRGMMLLNPSSYRVYTGRDKDGCLVQIPTEIPVYYMTIEDRNVLARLCAPVNAVITARMLKVSGLDWKITPVKKNEDRVVETLKSLRDIYFEYSDVEDWEHLTIRAKIVAKLKKTLPLLLPDLSNFDKCLVRFNKNISWAREDQVNEIEDWINKPYKHMYFSEIAKQMIFDMMVHGGVSLYKNWDAGYLKNFHILPGGTVIKRKAAYATEQDDAIQYLQLRLGYEPQVYGPDEISYIEYLPISAYNMSLIPLEALINKCLEYLATDRRTYNESDGTKPPQKMVLILDDKMPVGDLNVEGRGSINDEEARRIEKKLHKNVKNGVFILNGTRAEIVDISGTDTLSERLARQKDITQDVGLIFGATPMELNMAGSTDTSGRNTSEAQEDISQGRAVGPMVKSIEEYITYDIIQQKYNTNAYMLEADRGADKEHSLKLDLLELQTGQTTENELRERENKAPYEGDEYNRPRGSTAVGERGNEINPLMIKELD